MTIQTELRTKLLANGTISGLVGTRIYPVILPQKPTLPAITISKVSGGRLHNLSGTAGRAMPRISINSWDEDPLGVWALADAVRAVLDGFNGLLTTITTNAILDNEIDFYEDETNVYRVLQDFLLSHTEA